AQQLPGTYFHAASRSIPLPRIESQSGPDLGSGFRGHVADSRSGDCVSVESIMKHRSFRGARGALYLLGLLLATAIVAFSCKFVQSGDELLFNCDSSKSCVKDGFVCGYDNICRPIEKDCRSNCDGGCCLENRCVQYHLHDQIASASHSSPSYSSPRSS